MKKRAFGLFAAIVMLFCLLPGVALANETVYLLWQDTDGKIYYGMNQGSDKQELGVLYGQYELKGSYKLVSDITISQSGSIYDPFCFGINDDTIIDINGYTMTKKNGGNLFAVPQDKNFTLKGPGTARCTPGEGTIINLNGNSRVTLDGCTLSDAKFGIYSGEGTTHVIINSGTTIENCTTGIRTGSDYRVTLSLNGGIIKCTGEGQTAIESRLVKDTEGRYNGAFFANGGSVYGVVKNFGTIQKEAGKPGTNFYGTVENGFADSDFKMAGIIEAGNYYGTVNNNVIKKFDYAVSEEVPDPSSIQGGTFYGTVKNNFDYDTPATINGGIFNGAVTNNGTITGGLFKIAPSGTETWDVTFKPENGEEDVVYRAVKGTTITQIDTPTKEGNIFVGWFAEDAGTLFDFENTAINSDIILYAKWVSASATASSTFHTVRATAGEGGSLSESIVSLRPGESFTFEFTPNTGYAVADVRVDGKSVGAVESYTFRNLKADSTLEVEFAPVGATGTPADVDKNPNTGAQSALGAAAALAALSLLAAAAAAKKQQ